MASRKNQVRVKDNGAKRAIKFFKYVNPSLRVGWFGEKANADHGGLTIGELAAIHEFGLGVPQRSMIGDYVDLYRSELASALARLIRANRKLKPGDHPNDGIVRGLARFGAYVVGGIQKRIAAGIPPANAESTIARKGSSVPLIDTGQLRGSLAWEIEEGARGSL